MEMLRIVSMLIIVFHHAVLHGIGLKVSCRECDFIWFAGGVGVSCYVMISGYYMIRSRMTLAKMLKFWVTVVTYSLGLYVVLRLAVGGEEFSTSALVKSLTPLHHKTYWFASVYALLMLLSPFLNHFLLSLDRKGMLRFLATLTILLLLVPQGLSFYVGKLMWFLYLYSLAAAIRLYGESLVQKCSAKQWFGGTLLTALFIIVMVTVRRDHDFSADAIKQFNSYVIGKDTILSLLCAVCLFMGFARLRMGHIRWVNMLAACSFGVYLLHEYASARRMLWNDIFQIKTLLDSPYFFPYCLGVSLLVYAACTCVELLRLHTCGRLYDFCAPRWILPVAYRIWNTARRIFEKAAHVS